jgi:hypothetical protein
MRDSEILDIAKPILNARLAAQGFLGCEVKSEEDWDGHPVIVITAHLQKRSENPLDGADAQLEILDSLKDSGERRYVYLKIKTPEDDLYAEESDEDEAIGNIDENG